MIRLLQTPLSIHQHLLDSSSTLPDSTAFPGFNSICRIQQHLPDSSAFAGHTVKQIEHFIPSDCKEQVSGVRLHNSRLQGLFTHTMFTLMFTLMFTIMLKQSTNSKEAHQPALGW
jgi:hypothetical protein